MHPQNTVCENAFSKKVVLNTLSMVKFENQSTLVYSAMCLYGGYSMKSYSGELPDQIPPQANAFPHQVCFDTGRSTIL